MKYLNNPPMSDYFVASNNIFKAHESEPPLTMPLIHKLDALFNREIFVGERDVGPVASILATNAFMLLVSAIKQSLSGHTAAIFPLLRPAVESACYAYLVSKDDALGSVWINRHTDEKAMKACRGAFGQAVHLTSKKLDAEMKGSGRMLEELYQSLIDLGGHPNPRSILPYFTIPGEDDHYHFLNHNTLDEPNSWQVNWAILNCYAVGLRIAVLVSIVLKIKPLLRNGAAKLEVLMKSGEEYEEKMGIYFSAR